MQLRGASLIAFFTALILSASLLSCATARIEGDVIKIHDNRITIRQDDGSFTDISIANKQDVRMLDTVEIKGNRAIIKARLLDNDGICQSRSCF